MAANPNWESLSIEIPGKDLLEPARQGMEAVVLYLEVVKTILNTVKVFSTNINNPIKALVDALIQLINDLFETLRRTGLYAWYDVPNPLEDPNFNRFVGGFRAFTERFKTGLLDPRDPNRPQPVSGGNKGGFILIVADAEEPLALLKYMQVLLRFFSKEFITPQYPAPANFKVVPVGRTGDPILNVARLYQEQPTSLAIEWSLPAIANPGDPGFSDLIQAFSQNFIPPKFLIEKSEINPAVVELDIADLPIDESVGYVTASIPTKFRARGKGEVVSRKVRLKDQYGDQFFKFQRYIVVSTTSNTSTFLMGQLGTFRYIDSDVEQNKIYHYRVRAFSGELFMTRDDQITFQPPETNVIDTTPYLVWPGKDPIMGRASGAIPVMIPTYPEKFDVLENLKRLFQTAFSLNFHLPPNKEATFDGTTGLPTGAFADEHIVDIGKGSLTQLAGPLTSLDAIPLVNSLTSTIEVSAKYQPDPATGQLHAGPWNETIVRFNSARLATIVGSALLQGNSAVAFKALMESFPKPRPEISGLQANTLSDLVFEVTKVSEPNKSGQAAVAQAGVLYGDVYADANSRLNVLAAIEFCKSFTLIGTPPDWVQISILRDVAPWSGQILYELLYKMQTLLDAYAGVADEIKIFIDLLTQKIDTLENLLSYLTSILNFVESLSLGFYILSVPETDGDVGTWISLIDNAGGTKPPSGAGGYTGGVGLAYVAPDVALFKAALDAIF